MGREIRRVPFDFDHPLDEIWPGFQPDCGGCEDWDSGNDRCGIDHDCHKRYDPPEGKGYQVWETVSEGSPVTKVFATAEELIEYMHYHGVDGIFKACTRACARDFVLRSNWAPSMMLCNGGMVDGINAWSAMLHPFLHGFDLLSDVIVDHLRSISDEGDAMTFEAEYIEPFRERARKFTEAFRSMGCIYMAVKQYGEELPDTIKGALADHEKNLEKLYPKEENSGTE